MRRSGDAWQSGAVSDAADPQADLQADPQAHLHDGENPAEGVPSALGASDAVDPSARGRASEDLGALVGQWWTWGDVADELGIPATRVRQLVKDHHLAAAVPEAGAGQQVPALLIDGDEIVKGVPGLITMMHDNGFDDREILTWLFTDDDTLPGRPIDALRENRGREVKRRAQVMMAF
ncbi:hypothetical protein KLP28_02335 [Nocardioidaceae bacterium]|nr:hypothetical protein KLP28_02335 [Nocardioidaceae bacterium]